MMSKPLLSLAFTERTLLQKKDEPQSSQHLAVVYQMEKDEMKENTGFKAHRFETARFGLALSKNVLKFKTRGI